MATQGLSAQLYLTANTQSLNATSKQIQQALGRITGNASEFQKSLDASTARVFAFGATTSIIAGVGAALSNLVSSTIEVEDRLKQIQTIFGGTASEFNSFRDSIFSVAQSTGQAFSTVADAAAEFARQGLTATETASRLEAALILTRISGLDAVSSVNALTAAINGFESAGLTAVEITNKLAAVDKAFAVSSKDLAEAFSRTGSTAEDAGVKFDQLLGLVTAVQQTTSRGGAVIGNAFKSIFTRLSRASVIDDLKALGVEIDASQDGVQKLYALSNALQSITDPTQISAIKELAGGVYQVNVVSASLKDLADSSGIYARATATAVGATNEAYKQNKELNETIKSQLNSLVVGFTNLAEKIGQTTFAPILKNLVTLANGFGDFFNKALDPESGNKLIQGIFKSIGSFLSGPGLVIITTAFIKIFTLVARYAKEGFKSILQIGTQTEKIQGLEAGLVNLLKRDDVLRKAIENTTLSQLEKQKAIGEAILRENKLLAEQERILRSIATVAYNKGARSVSNSGEFLNRKGKPVTNAQGYIPNFASGYDAEKAGAREHGYIAGAVRKTRIYDGNGKSFESFVNTREKITNFKNAKGKKATLVEPPNGFGKGTQFAAQGFIPNFANEDEAYFTKIFSKLTKKDIEKRYQVLKSNGKGSPVALKVLESLLTTSTASRLAISKNVNAVSNTSEAKVRSDGLVVNTNPNEFLAKKGILDAASLEKFRQGDSKSFQIGNQIIREANVNFSNSAFAKARKFAEIKEQRKANFIDDYEIDAKSLGGIAVVSPRFGGVGKTSAQSKVNKLSQFFSTKASKAEKAQGKTSLFDQSLESQAGEEIVKIRNIDTSGIPTAKTVSKTSEDINKYFSTGLVRLATSLYGNLFDVADRGKFAKKLGGFAGGDAGGIFSPTTEGGLFEAASKVALTSMQDMEGAFNSNNENRPFDFTNRSAMKQILGVDVGRGEAKRLGASSDRDEINSVVKKTFNDPEYGQAALAQLTQQRQSSPNRALAQAKTAKEKAEKAAVKNAAGGFIPNFASVGKDINGDPIYRSNKLLGSGYFGDFFQLNNKKRGEQDIGVKKFKSKKFNENDLTDYIKEEYASAKLLAEVPIVKGITGPKVIGSLKRSLEAKRVGKQVVSDPLGRDALGSEISRELGEVMTSTLFSKGLRATDLHGRNYALNQNGADFISEDDSHLTLKSSFDRSGAEDLDFFKNFALNGGKATIVDAGFLEPVSAELQQKHKEYSTLTNASGFIPNFASPNALKSLQLRAAYKGADPRLLAEASNARRILSKQGLKNSINLKGVFDKLDGETGISQIIDSAFSVAGPTASNEDVFKVFEQQVKQNPQQLRELVKKKGFVPNFAMGNLMKGRNVFQSNWMKQMAKKRKLKVNPLGFPSNPDDVAKLGAEFAKMYPNGQGMLAMSKGFIPNFSAVKEAISREKKAGVPASKIYVDSDPSLVSSKNPFGQMVANTRDEPKGGYQGIARARKEGRDPKSYGSAKGFVPNYATFKPQINREPFGNQKFDLNQLAKVQSFIKYLNIMGDQFAKDNISLKTFIQASRDSGKQLGLTGDALKKFTRDLGEQATAFKGGQKKKGGPTLTKLEKFDKFSDGIGKAQIALFSLSAVANSVSEEGSELNKYIQNGVAIFSTIGALSPLISTAISTFSTLAAGSGIVAKTLTGLAGATTGAAVAIAALPAAFAGGLIYATSLADKETDNAGSISKNSSNLSLATLTLDRERKATFGKDRKVYNDFRNSLEESNKLKLNQAENKVRNVFQAAAASGNDVNQEDLAAAKENLKEVLNGLVVEMGGTSQAARQEKKDREKALKDFNKFSADFSFALEKVSLSLSQQASKIETAKSINLDPKSKYGDLVQNSLSLDASRNAALQSKTKLQNSFEGVDIATLFSSFNPDSNVKTAADNLRGSIADPNFANEILTALEKGGEKGVVKTIESKAGGKIDTASDNGKKLIESLVENAQSFKKEITEGFVNATNAQTESFSKRREQEDEIRAIAQKRIELEKKAFDELPARLSELLSTQKVDPVALAKGYQDVKRLQDKGDSLGAAKRFASLKDQEESFKTFGGQDALNKLRESQGLTQGSTKKLEDSAALSVVDIAGLRKIFEGSIVGKDARKALDSGSLDSKSVDALLNKVKESLTALDNSTSSNPQTERRKKLELAKSTLESVQGRKTDKDAGEKSELNKQQKEAVDKIVTLNQEIGVFAAKITDYTKAFGEADILKSVQTLNKSLVAASNNLNSFGALSQNMSSLSITVNEKIKSLEAEIRASKGN
jgi:TP901 family phage tail tape measure protein